MLLKTDYTTARDLLFDLAHPVETELLPLEQCAGRILAEALLASENVPPFDRSAYDGYTFRAEDVATASEEAPVTLQVLEEIPAGSTPTKEITQGTASKILTGAPIPQGANVVIKYELTKFTEDSVTLFAPVKAGANIVGIGEDVKAGTVLAAAGRFIDAGLMGTLAAQGKAQPLVYKKPIIGIISTGSELVDVKDDCAPGKIRNSNRYTLTSALTSIGCDARFLGLAGDRTEDIAVLIKDHIDECDAILLTGGVSVGDYDLTPDAMQMAGAEILLQHIRMKPGMACCFGTLKGKLICGLSGNPASAATTYYAVVQPALRKLTGRTDAMPEEFTVELAEEFKRKSPIDRFLRGKLLLSGGKIRISICAEQGNAVLSSMIGCDIMALIPGGSGPLPAGTPLKAILL